MWDSSGSSVCWLLTEHSSCLKVCLKGPQVAFRCGAVSSLPAPVGDHGRRQQSHARGDRRSL